MKKSTLITGVAGFIGSALALELLTRGESIVGIDNINDYYDVNLKKNRLVRCEQYSDFQFECLDIADRFALEAVFKKNHFSQVIHLAAQAGVRYSLENPYAYADSNLIGFLNILENCRHHKISHLVYASSSSVYGANTKLPFLERDAVDHPVSLYAATKRANELMAHSYAYLYDLPCTGLRFFTVYGPWGRPDMSLFTFTKNIIDEKPITVFNHGNMMRDFTYIDDIIAGIVRIMDVIPQKQKDIVLNPSVSHAPYRIYNIGNQFPIELKKYIEVVESCLLKKAQIIFLPMQDGDVHNTYADVAELENIVGTLPHTTIDIGVQQFVAWYRTYYCI
ncbi:MAG: hypothetical protein ACD_29C00371G0001 [uncultured bacterium]|nr:MAG: hypothetical protein ACD_29C00371G0001 [uncultured bacterium]